MKFLLVCLFVGQISFHAEAESQSPSEKFNKAKEESLLTDMEPRIRAALLRANLNIEDYELSYELTKLGRDYYLTSKSEICKFNLGYIFTRGWAAEDNPESDTVECYKK